MWAVGVTAAVSFAWRISAELVAGLVGERIIIGPIDLQEPNAPLAHVAVHVHVVITQWHLEWVKQIQPTTQLAAQNVASRLHDNATQERERWSVRLIVTRTVASNL